MGALHFQSNRSNSQAASSNRASSATFRLKVPGWSPVNASERPPPPPRRRRVPAAVSTTRRCRRKCQENDDWTRVTVHAHLQSTIW
ncbi:hypothetical protein JYU34_013952 [Plutella xylostella]|uniref:Uncharacterized protein n=1 Tax=Plutella xylostella TaxID=51655 RepID=A0ABQ7QC03_PLUXY|nr:hypothetical protein JYU34_013952 [Plutella xylostella]